MTMSTNNSFTPLSFSPDETPSRKVPIKDSNSLYKQCVEKPQEKYEETAHYRMLDNLEKQINDTLYSYKTEKERQRKEIREIRKSIKGREIATSVGMYKSNYNRAKSPSLNKTVNNKVERQAHLRSENASLIQKLNKAKAKITVQKEELTQLRKKYLEKCEEVANKNKSNLSEWELKRQYTNEIVSKLNDELSFLRSELAKRDDELNMMYAENRRTREHMPNTTNWRENMCKILLIGAKEYDYLRGTDFEKYADEALLEQVTRLLGYLISEKKELEEKYTKLLTLHDSLVDKGNKREYSAEQIYMLADENEVLKKEVNALRVKKL